MRQIHDKHYTNFTSKERLNLTLAALARGDEIEADKLWQTCPRYLYRAHDFLYTLSLNALTILNSFLFEKCVLHYNHIKKIDEFILEAGQDLSFEENEKLIESLEKSRNIQISRLKGLLEGFKLFCTDVNLDYENAINIMPIRDCCHDLDYLLESSVSANMEYVEQVKCFFLQQWGC
ncbi:MAG TPA: hypothetical protein VLI69_06505 [Gammaproteobacteria bacterium]|nr:hypothetical protein [Gammaproteobacteria bacterium]